MSENTELFLRKPSEFGGSRTEKTHGIQPAVAPEQAAEGAGHTDLTPSEKLRLTYRTGQDEDQAAPADPHAWTGG